MPNGCKFVSKGQPTSQACRLSLRIQLNITPKDNLLDIGPGQWANGRTEVGFRTWVCVKTINSLPCLLLDEPHSLYFDIYRQKTKYSPATLDLGKSFPGNLLMVRVPYVIPLRTTFPLFPGFSLGFQRFFPPRRLPGFGMVDRVQWGERSGGGGQSNLAM